jgi:hypothetical protein
MIVPQPPSPPWNPSNATRWLIAVVTLWPPAYMVLFMGFIGFSFFSADRGGAPPPQFSFFKYIFPLHCMTMLLMFALIAVYVVHAFKNERFTQEMRILWILILFMGNFFAFPIYWWLYLRPGVDLAATTASPGDSSAPPV